MNLIFNGDTSKKILLFMADSTTPTTGATGKTLTVRLSKNGAAFAAGAGTVAELEGGFYAYTPATADVGTDGPLGIRATATGAVDFIAVRQVVPWNVYDAVRLGLSALPNAAAAASGGLVINGTNTGTVTLAAFTISGNTTFTGTTVYTGNVSMAAGLTITQSTTNGSGISVTGNGSGNGIITTGGATGTGLRAVGGSTSGDGARFIAGAIGHGLSCIAAGASQHGLNCTAGAVGANVGHGISATGSGSGSGMNLVGAGSGGDGLTIASSQGYGVQISTTAPFSGLRIAGGPAIGSNAGQNAVTLIGGAASTTSGGTAGAGLYIIGGAGAGSTNGAGPGVRMLGGGTNTVASAAHGLIVTGASNGDGLSAVAGSGGVDIRGNITGNITGTVTTTTNLTNLPTMPTDWLTAAGLSAGAVTEIQSGLATAASITTLTGYVDTEIGSIKGITDQLATMLEVDGPVYRFTTNALEMSPAGGGGGTSDWTVDELTSIRTILGIPASGTTPDTPSAGVLKTINDKTTNLPADPADASDIAASFTIVNTALTTIASYLDTEVAAILEDTGTTIPATLALIQAKTDNLPTDPADASVIAVAFTGVTDTLATVVARTNLIPDDPADASVINGEFGGINDTLANLSTAVSDKTGYKLAADGLDLIVVTDPAATASLNIVQGVAIIAGVAGAEVHGADTGDLVWRALNNQGLTIMTGNGDEFGNRDNIVITPPV